MVSAIISTYKRSPEIVERAIKSIINQTYKDIEIIVVDDSPSDYSERNLVAKMVSSYADSNVKYIQHEVNKGACAARNTGIDNSSGEYLAFLDDDDEWCEDKIEKQLAVMEASDNEIGLVYCGNYTKNDITGELKTDAREYHDGDVFDRVIERNFIGSTSFPLLKRQAVLEAGKFDVEMLASQDADLWIRVAEKYKIGFVAEPLVIYHVHPGEAITGNHHNKILALNRLYKKHEEYLATHPHARWRRKMAYIEHYSAVEQYGKMFGEWFKAMLICPYEIKANYQYLKVAVANAIVKKIRK